MELDFFREGNDLKEKSKEELIRGIESFMIENEKIIDDLKIKEDVYIKSNMEITNSFLTEDLNFSLDIKKGDKVYKFLKDKVEYKIEISSYFISYYKNKEKITYAYSVTYKNYKWKFQSLKEYENEGRSNNYYDKDVSQYLKEYDNSKEVLSENVKVYEEVKELEVNDLFEYNIKVSRVSIPRYAKDCKKYNNFIDFIKEIL